MRRAVSIVIGTVLGCTASRPPAPRPSTSAVGSTAPAETPTCNDLSYDSTEPTEVDAPTLCRHLRDELKPAAFAAAIRCLQATAWSICDRSRCITTALSSASPEMDDRCARVETGCAGMGELCEANIAGMNTVGRERFAGCLVENCGTGLRRCLWDPMSSPCDAP